MTIFECDGCKKQVARKNGIKPDEWFVRTDLEDETKRQTRDWHACSRECIEKISEEFKITKVVLPL